MRLSPPAGALGGGSCCCACLAATGGGLYGAARGRRAPPCRIARSEPGYGRGPKPPRLPALPAWSRSCAAAVFPSVAAPFVRGRRFWRHCRLLCASRSLPSGLSHGSLRLFLRQNLLQPALQLRPDTARAALFLLRPFLSLFRRSGPSGLSCVAAPAGPTRTRALPPAVLPRRPWLLRRRGLFRGCSACLVSSPGAGVRPPAGAPSPPGAKLASSPLRPQPLVAGPAGGTGRGAGSLAWSRGPIGRCGPCLLGAPIRLPGAPQLPAVGPRCPFGGRGASVLAAGSRSLRGHGFSAPAFGLFRGQSSRRRCSSTRRVPAPSLSAAFSSLRLCQPSAPVGVSRRRRPRRRRRGVPFLALRLRTAQIGRHDAAAGA